jgi:hypothetical protein
MDNIIRRTVTITTSETWTIVWGDVQSDDKLQPHATTIVQAQLITQEESNALLQATVTIADSDAPSVNEPMATPLKRSAGSQRKRTRRRRAAGS